MLYVPFTRTIVLAISLLTCSSIDAQSLIKDLSHFAQESDFIGVVQVANIQYKTVRKFPVKGEAELDILISYKRAEALEKGAERITVKAEGLDDNQCYYRDVENEGARYLVFLNYDGKDEFTGLKPACALPVLVTDDAGYALLYPMLGLMLEDESLVKNLTFTDPYAWIDLSPFTRDKVQYLKDYYHIEVDEYEDKGLYTRGIPLADVRSHLLKLDH